MQIPEFANACQGCGLRISNKQDYFFLRSGLINYSFPPYAKVKVDRDIIRLLKWRYLITVLLTDWRQKNTYEFILTTNNYLLETFTRKVRNRIHKSLNNCSFRRPEFDELLISGLQINIQTLKRQSRNDKLLSDPKKWRKYIECLYNNENVTILGAYYCDKMVGYLIMIEIEGKYNIQHAYIDKKDCEVTTPMNGLIFTLINQLIREKGMIKVSYGLDSIKDLSDLNRFKTNMLFEKVPLTRLYIINPLILPFFKLTVFFLIKILKRRHIRNNSSREIIHIYYGNRLLKKVLATSHT